MRAASPSRRLSLALSLSRTAMTLARAGLAHPDASPEEIGLLFVALNYGSDLADEVRADLAARRS